MGNLPVKAAVDSGAIEIEGSRDLRQRFERWLGLSGFAAVKDARRPTGGSIDRIRSEQQTSLRRPV
jgi:hypothetical protein